MKALEGYRSVEEARRAFVDAAMESDVLVSEDRLVGDRLH